MISRYVPAASLPAVAALLIVAVTSASHAEGPVGPQGTTGSGQAPAATQQKPEGKGNAGVFGNSHQARGMTSGPVEGGFYRGRIMANGAMPGPSNRRALETPNLWPPTAPPKDDSRTAA